MYKLQAYVSWLPNPNGQMHELFMIGGTAYYIIFKCKKTLMFLFHEWMIMIFSIVMGHALKNDKQELYWSISLFSGLLKKMEK